MATKNLIPRGSGEGGLGISDTVWGHGYFDTGHFNKGLYISGLPIDQALDQAGVGGKWEDSATAGDIYYNGGNAGIGTSDPVSRLHVSTNSANTINLTREIDIIGLAGGAACKIEGGALAGTAFSNGAAIGFTLLDSDGTDSGGATEGYLYFETKDSGTGLSEKMRIDSVGNIGIGTTNPKSELNVTANNSGQGAILTLENSDTSMPNYFGILKNCNISLAPKIMMLSYAH